MEKYSDLLIEQLQEFGRFKPNGESTHEQGSYDFSREDYEISTPAEAKRFKKQKGKYSLLSLPHALSDDEKAEKYYLTKLTRALKDYMPTLTPTHTILVIGLGNRHISADSLGTEVVKGVNITRGFDANLPQLCAIAPSVLGLTGIETADTIDALIKKIKPHLVIMIDSLCAGHANRLGTSFQISSTPIVPGSGINNSRKKVKTTTQTISIGVPFVVYSHTFVRTALQEANISASIPQNNNLLVTLKDIEYSVKKAGSLIAQAINNVIFS